FGRIRECATASTPQGRGRHTSTSATGAFLAPRLLGGMLDFSAILLGAVAGTCVGLVGNDDLMHERFVEFTTKNRVGCIDRSRRLTLIIQELDFHYAPFPAALTDGRTTMFEPAWPGTAPRTSSRPRSTSTRMTSRF